MKYKQWKNPPLIYKKWGVGEQKKWYKYKTHGRIEEINGTILVITTNITGLNSSGKKTKINSLDKEI